MTEPRATIAVNLLGMRGIVRTVQDLLGETEVVVATDDDRAPDAEILAVFSPDREVVRRAVTPGVRWIHALSAGVDGFPLDLATGRVFTCSRGASAVPIAEWTMAMLLAPAKRLPESWIVEPPQHWSRAELASLEGQTLGLVGIGAIGSEVATRALAFSMDVVAIRRTDAPAPQPDIELVTSFRELLERSDHLVLAAPGTADTHHLVDAEALASMRPDAHLVNIARGSLVDQDALIAGLDRGQLAAASLDAVEPDPLPAGHPLYSHPKVRLSPHIWWGSPRTLGQTLEMFVGNVRRYRDGEPLHGLVDMEAGY